jgi:hypothetical protein
MSEKKDTPNTDDQVQNDELSVGELKKVTGGGATASLLSNIMKKIDSTDETVVNNLK